MYPQKIVTFTIIECHCEVAYGVAKFYLYPLRCRIGKWFMNLGCKQEVWWQVSVYEATNNDSKFSTPWEMIRTLSVSLRRQVIRVH